MLPRHKSRSGSNAESENSLYGNRLAWCKISSKATTQVCSYSKKASARLVYGNRLAWCKIASKATTQVECWQQREGAKKSSTGEKLITASYHGPASAKL